VVHRSFSTREEAIEADGDSRLARLGYTRVDLSKPFGRKAQAAEYGPTVAEFAHDLLGGRQLKQNTRDMYATALRRIEREALSNKRLNAVTASDIRTFFDSVTANRNNIRATLAKVFNAAVREGLIRQSPLSQAGIKIAKKKNGKHLRVLDPYEVERLAATAAPEFQLPIRLGAYVGLRAGEVGGLRVEDIDLEGCRIRVRRNAQKTSAGYIFETPKSETSERDLKVPCSIVEDAKTYMEIHPPLADGTIFYTSQGNPMTNQVLTSNTIKAAKAAGIRRVTFHDLRHTCASLLIAHRFEPKAIQVYLGHSNIRMTYDVYGHLFPKADDPLAEGTLFAEICPGRASAPAVLGRQEVRGSIPFRSTA
jgi:integrase